MLFLLIVFGVLGNLQAQQLQTSNLPAQEGLYRPQSLADKSFIDDLEDLSKKHGYLQIIKDQGNDSYVVEFIKNKYAHLSVDLTSDTEDRVVTIYSRMGT